MMSWSAALKVFLLSTFLLVFGGIFINFGQMRHLLKKRTGRIYSTVAHKAKHQEPALHLHQVGKIFFNRIPKTGSRGTRDLMQEVNQYSWNEQLSFLNKPINMTAVYYNQSRKDINLLRTLSRRTRPWILTPHFQYFDFKSMGTEFSNSTYITVVRDPIKRVVSHYNYIRQHEYTNAEWTRTPEDRNRHIDACVQEKHVECSSRYFTHETIAYFCGYHPTCRHNTRDALNKAKSNFWAYSVVGILEEYKDFWLQLEHTFPEYFSAAVQAYNSAKKLGKDHDNKTKYKYLPSNKTLELMKVTLHLEIEFYEWIKKHVHDRVKKIEQSK